MSDDFGTINVRRGERSRELDVLRQQYQRHREALEEMIADAPTESLATEYIRLIQEIGRSLGKLDELEGRPAPAAAAAGPAPRGAAAAAAGGATVPPAVPAGQDPKRLHGDPLRGAAEPGMRPLSGAAQGTRHGADSWGGGVADANSESRLRGPLIIAAVLLAVALVGWLIWRASSDDQEPTAVVDETTIAPVTAGEETDTIAPAGTSDLVATPAAQSFGVVRKGTRATRQFELTNNTDEPMTVQIERSACRCLYYEYSDLIPPRGKESVTVTIDGARASAGELREDIAVKAKNDPTATATLGVEATIR